MPIGNNPSATLLAGDAVYDFVDRAVAARGHDPFKAFRGGVARDGLSLAGAGRRAQDRSRA